MQQLLRLALLAILSFTYGNNSFSADIFQNKVCIKAFKKTGFEYLYNRATELKRELYNPTQMPYIVFSIGGPGFGGVGKTPAAIKLSQIYLSLGYQPIILTKGYGRKSKKPVILDIGMELPADIVEQAGDEPTLIHQLLDGQVPVLISEDRAAIALEYARHRHFVNRRPILIVESGMQQTDVKVDVHIGITSPGELSGRLPLRDSLETYDQLAQIKLVLHESYRKKTIFPNLLLNIYHHGAIGAITTRANTDKYFAQIDREYNRDFKYVHPVKLADHADKQKIIKSMVKTNYSAFLIGGKEAINLLPPKAFSRLQKQGQMPYKLPNNRMVTLYYVDLEVSFYDGFIEDILEKIEAMEIIEI